MTSELLLRFLVGGLVVSTFAVIGDIVRPKSFAGIFGAAPSVALASLGLAFLAHTGAHVAIAARSMIAPPVTQEQQRKSYSREKRDVEMRIRLLIAILAAGVLGACNGPPLGPEPQTFEFDFTISAHGWTAGFSDYPVDHSEQMELRSGHEPLPAGVGREGHGLHIAGTNHSDDLFMFWKRQVEGLEPNTRYRLSVEVEFATEAPSGCAGIGGPPGEAVYVKVGATAVEPRRQVEEVGGRDYYQMSIDKGNQAAGGADAVVIGDVSNSNTDCTNPVWEIKTLQTDQPLEVTPASDGTTWLLVGTDSGFEGRTRLYYTRYRAVFDPL